MEYTLLAPQKGLLPYPHYTKMSNGKAHIVTHPDRLFKENDVVFFNESLETAGHPHKVIEVLEQRKARGQHVTDFEPIFQKIKIVPVK